MSRVYTISGENLTLGTGSVLVAIQTAAALSAGARLALLRLEIGQSGSTTSAMCRAEIFVRDTAGTLTMTSATPRPRSPLSGPASAITGSTAPAGAVARCGINSSADSGGAYTSIQPFAFNNLNGYLWVPTPAEMIDIPPSTLAGVRFIAAPSTTTGWTFNLTFEELT